MIPSSSGLLEHFASLPLRICTVDVAAVSRPSLAGGVRRSSIVRMRGLNVEGLGEDVTFQADDLLRAPPPRRVWARTAGVAVRVATSLWRNWSTGFLTSAAQFARIPEDGSWSSVRV